MKEREINLDFVVAHLVAVGYALISGMSLVINMAKVLWW